MKIKIDRDKVILPLNMSQGGIRIADGHGNHVSRPTKAENKPGYLVEWMITNAEIKGLADKFLDEAGTGELTNKLEQVAGFTDESRYSKRETIKVERQAKEKFKGFNIYQYVEKFSSFEKRLDSGLRVRITFKLGAYGLEPHPHMYVLIPFDNPLVEIENKEGKVKKKEMIGSGGRAVWKPNKKDLKEIVVTLAHASADHRDSLIEILRSED